MKAGNGQLKPTLIVFIIYLCFCTTQNLKELQVCSRCSGTVLDGSAVGLFCSSSAGRIAGRCCMGNKTSDHERIIGLDLSNCSLNHVEYLQEASTALLIDLSRNTLVNISDLAFQGFTELNYLILPADIACPGGNSSWEKVELKEGNWLCEGQKNMCNQTGQMSVHCPEFSQCGPFGPGFFECSCADNYYGYKCLRQGEFPGFQVFGAIGASTLVLSLLLWVTQRRKAKSL
ncbi:all-trans retinoic acid-induced differentiation factor [Dunckerocampus dactyliophorus]|uniref:all-trans retinoic acid-induced differentiation factor n=1 Tax=Dunckerocampus dactyliophorus TaxID=161453 RepID=UPI0024076E11|nr:all-trans retinoic acid-induced differentiation factor [Dunckerocampus dactyliophorus]